MFRLIPFVRLIRSLGWRLLLTGAFIGARTSPAPSQVIYVITDLGALGAPRGVNASGQVAGSYDVTSTGPTHAFRTAPNGPIILPGSDLGTLGGGGSLGSGINASGQVTGTSSLPGNVPQHAYRTTATGRISDPGTDLGTFTGGGNSFGQAINDVGQVAGYADVSGGTHAFRTTATGKVSDAGTDLGVFPGGTRSFGQAINESGQVAGYSEYAPAVPPNVTGPTRAFRTTAIGLITDANADLGTLGGSTSAAFGINASGQVTGSSRVTGDLQEHAFRSSPNGQPLLLTDLGTLGGNQSIGYAINSFGVVVGSDSAKGAFIYDTQMRDLNLLIPPGSGWSLGFAYGINDAGQITGVGSFSGQSHAFLLTPVGVPEPGGLALLGAAAGAWVWRRRRIGQSWTVHPSKSLAILTVPALTGM
jgi:probable HAF family extracellular repeat protein